MSTTSTTELPSVTVGINRYLSIALFLFGLIGNVLCCLVFIQRTFRSNLCARYFLIASIANLISLVSGIPPRLLSSWSILPDYTETVTIFCTSRLFVLLTSRNIASWLLVLAAMDRYLISSANVNTRRLSQAKQALRWMGIVCVASLVFWTETFYCFDANLLGTPLKCYAKSTICRVFNDLSQAFITTLIPSSCMLIFGLLTITNIRQRLRIRPVMVVNINTHPLIGRRRKTEHNLTQMLFVQVILLTVFNLPQAIQKFYLTYTFYQMKSTRQIVLENFVFNIVVLMTYVPNCLPFYLYILTSDLFRSNFLYFSQKIRQRLTRAIL